MKPEIEDRLNRSEIQVGAKGPHFCMFVRDGCLAVVPCDEDTFGQRVRDLRKQQKIDQRTLAERVAARLQAHGGRGFDVTYLSKIENDRVDFAAFPSEATIRKLAEVLDSDVDDLLLKAEKIPDHIRKRGSTGR